MNPQPDQEPNPLESMNTMRRRKFLGLAAFASASVIGVGLAGVASPAAANSAERTPPDRRTDPATGWPIFDQEQPPQGYVRSHSPCSPNEYVDVPVDAVAAPRDQATVIHPPYQHSDWHRIPGGQQ